MQVWTETNPYTEGRACTFQKTMPLPQGFVGEGHVKGKLVGGRVLAPWGSRILRAIASFGGLESTTRCNGPKTKDFSLG